MAKTKVHYVCQQCGRAAPKPLGRCPQCGEWNSMVEEFVEPHSGATTPRLLAAHPPRRLSEIEGDGQERIGLELQEFARVLGGGIVPGSVVLIGGDPGIGKSTLLLQLASLMANGAAPVLYVSGEESPQQIK
ncbi:MAG TPA: AAA family ATPase, partial [Anaerolineales bacterium]|nr:AAA family ATPase [Anaerolineales bacterium]